jgi:hypothetical protein
MLLLLGYGRSIAEHSGCCTSKYLFFDFLIDETKGDWFWRTFALTPSAGERFLPIQIRALRP